MNPLEAPWPEREKTHCLKPGAAQCEKQWQADIQLEAMIRHGLEDEFPYGCYTIDYVAEALVAARRRIAELESELSKKTNVKIIDNRSDYFGGAKLEE